MPTVDRAIRVELRTKRRSSVLAAVRKAGRPIFETYELWGLVEQADKGIEEFVGRLDAAESVWSLAAERWVRPNLLALLIQILSEAWETHLLERVLRGAPHRLRPAIGLPLSPADVRRVIRDLRAALRWVEKPPHQGLESLVRRDLGQELDNLARLYEILERQLSARALPVRKGGRPIEAVTELEKSLGILLGGNLRATERRRWTARVISDFLQVPTTVDQLRRREAARTSAARRGPKRH